MLRRNPCRRIRANAEGGRANLNKSEGLNPGPAVPVEKLLADVMDDSRWPIALVGSDLELIWANRAAREELDAGLSFSVSGGQLTLGNEADDDRLKQFLADCDHHDRIFTQENSVGEPILARCRAVRSEETKGIFYLSFFRPSQKPENVEPPLSVLFGLTSTEERVLSMLVDGHTADYVSETLNVSIATIRKHISNAYSKIGVCSREELFARLRVYS